MSTNQVPQYFICPITHNIMNEPYVDNEGNSYEEVAIKHWLDFPLALNGGIILKSM